MRIDLNNSAASQLSNDVASKPGSTNSSSTATPVDHEDRATFTAQSTSVASLVSTALSSPEVRQGQVDNLKAAINTGGYVVDLNKIAASILEG